MGALTFLTRGWLESVCTSFCDVGVWMVETLYFIEDMNSGGIEG